MVYEYLYQTRDNENKSGEIRAKNRAEAYAALRKQGIKPYRLIGDDPTWWQMWHWHVAGGVAALAILFVAGDFIFYFAAAAKYGPAKRAQLQGDMQFIAKGVADGWQEIFPSALDRRLAAYAQPGWKLEPQEATAEEAKSYIAELEIPIERSREESPEVRQLKNIVEGMRGEMREYLASGGTVADYLEFLEERQQRESDLRDKARETLERAPEDMRRRAWLNLNIRLGDMGIALLPEPQ